MRVVLIDSPGPASAPHWSRAFADGLAAALGNAQVVRRFSGTAEKPAPMHRVTAGLMDIALEVELTRSLRQDPVDVVIHVGVGARGSPNLLWIAERMGCLGVAVVRASEVVCQRGDLVDWEGNECRAIDEPARCERCCRQSFFRRSIADEFATRLDLVVAGLQVCAAVWLVDGDDTAALEQVGVPRRAIETAPEDELIARVAAGLVDLSASDAVS